MLPAKLSQEDRAAIMEIVTKVADLGKWDQPQRLTATIKVCQFHARHGLKLKEMSEWKRMSDLAHDVAGIANYYNNDTGTFSNMMWPRFGRDET